jgi:hypothetical protein
MSVEVKGATLMKRSRNRSVLSIGINWQLRRISLSETKITYGTPDGPPKDFIPINSGTVVSNWSGDGKEFGFRTQTGADELILLATSAEDCEEWIQAIRNVANPPPPPSTGNAELDRINRENHERALAAQRAADEAERQAREAQKLGAFTAALSIADVAVGAAVGDMVGGGVMGALAGAAVGLAAAEAERLALEALQKKKAEEEAAKKEALYAKLRVPVSVAKKTSSESSYHTPRFIWINDATNEFHWAKSDDVTKSKCINIKEHVKGVRTVGEVGAPNFSIDMQNHDSIFSGLFSSVPDALDVKMDDHELNDGFMQYIREIQAR